MQHEHPQVMVRFGGNGDPLLPASRVQLGQPHHINQPLQVPQESITFKNIKNKIQSWLSRRDTMSQRSTKPVLGLCHCAARLKEAAAI